VNKPPSFAALVTFRNLVLIVSLNRTTGSAHFLILIFTTQMDFFFQIVYLEPCTILLFFIQSLFLICPPWFSYLHCCLLSAEQFPIILFCLSRVSSLDSPFSHLTHSCYPEPLICSDHVGSLYFIHLHGQLSSLSVVFNVTYILLSSRIEGGWKCNSFHQHLSNTRYKSGKLAICTTSRVRRDLGAAM
jgi:hypothetical protein